jgi:hypothetical protein
MASGVRDGGICLGDDVPSPAGFEVASAAGPTWSTVITPADNWRLRIRRAAASTLGWAGFTRDWDEDVP